METNLIKPVELPVALPWQAFGLAGIAYLLGGTVSTLMATALPVAIPELLGNPVSDAQLGEVGAYINAAFLYGWMVGGLLFGVLSDRIGRVRGLALVTALYGLATVLTVFVPNWYGLLACRFVTGMGVGGVLLLATVYLSEVWPPSSRTVVLGVLAVTFPIGIVASGGLNVLFSDWRQAFWLGLIPLAVGVSMLWLLPESADWQQTRTPSAGQPERVFTADNRVALITGSVVYGSVLIGLWGIFSWLPTWIQSLLPPGQTGQTERGLTMLLLGVGGIIGGVASGFLLNSIGSRQTLLLTFVGCTAGCGLLFLTNDTFTPVIYAETALLSLFLGISQGALSSYIPALFPVAIRASATGFSFNIGRFFTATAVFFVGTLAVLLGGFSHALLLFSLAFLLALATVWLRVGEQKQT